MTFAIIRKDTKEFFAGFDVNGVDIWTASSTNVWTRDKFTATCQASLFITLGLPIQRRGVRQ